LCNKLLEKLEVSLLVKKVIALFWTLFGESEFVPSPEPL
jgi:hypothetical protein